LYLRVAYAFLELKALLKTLANRARFLRPTAAFLCGETNCLT